MNIYNLAIKQYFRSVPSQSVHSSPIIEYALHFEVKCGIQRKPTAKAFHVEQTK